MGLQVEESRDFRPSRLRFRLLYSGYLALWVVATLFAFMFLDTPEKFTLSRGVVQLAGSVHLSKQLVMAASVMVTIPILVLFFFFERRLVQGLTAGAMKG